MSPSNTVSNSKLFEIAAKFAVKGQIISISPYGNGTINETYLVITKNGKVNERSYILQKLHPFFRVPLLLLYDLEAVTDRLHHKGIITPKLIKTRHGDPGYFQAINGIAPDCGSDCWRMLTFIPGKTVDRVADPEMVRNAAQLLGRFHAALADFDYQPVHILPDFHNFSVKISKMLQIVQAGQGTSKYDALRWLSDEIHHAYNRMTKMDQLLPDRIIHGDLKISNVRFDREGKQAIALIDLDTLARHKIVIDLGDAIRSWCNPAEEDDERHTNFDLKLFTSFIVGYFETAEFLTQEEANAIIEGTELIILELAARFIADAFNESYFRLNTKRYPSLYEQNRAKTRAQMKLYFDLMEKKKKAARIVKACYEKSFK